MLGKTKILRSKTYQARWYQELVRRALFRDGYRFIYGLFHRRAGKDIGAFNLMVEEAAKGIPGTYYYICPTYTQAKKIIWNGIDERGLRIIDYIPRELISKVNNSEMLLRLRNGSIIQVVGADDPDALRGTNPRGVVLSEYAMMNRRIWDEVLSPILRKNGGWAFFQTTPLGRNHAFDLWQMALTNDEWYTLKITVDDTGLISKDQIDKERQQGKPEAVIQQEYYCSFSKGLIGAYYQETIDKMYREERIGVVPWEPDLPVHVALDLGISDATSLVWFQMVGREIHFIEADEHVNQSLRFYVKLIREKPYVYGHYFFPHDINIRELSSGLTRVETLRELGVEANVLPRTSISWGVDNVRKVLASRAYIDAKKCSGLVKALEHYHREYDEKNQIVKDKPKHDWSCHYADCMRYACQGAYSVCNNDDGAFEYKQRLARLRPIA